MGGISGNGRTGHTFEQVKTGNEPYIFEMEWQVNLTCTIRYINRSDLVSGLFLRRATNLQRINDQVILSIRHSKYNSSSGLT